MSTETKNKKIKIDNGTTFGRTYTDKAIDAKLPTDLIASANKLSLGIGNAPLGNGVNLSGFTYDEATKTLKASGGSSIPIVEGTTVEPTEEEQSLGVTAKWSIPTTQSNNFIFHTDDDDWYFMSCSQGIYVCDFIIPGAFDIILYGAGTFIYLMDDTTLTNTILYCTISDFNNGDHDDNSFVMPTGDVVAFIDQNDKYLIGRKHIQDNIVSYICYESTVVVENGLYKYKYFSYKITKSNRGYNVEKTDLSAVLDENILFLPNYSRNDNGKILAINSGSPEWVSISTPTITNILPLPADASTSNYVLKAVNGTVQWVKEA